jgi:hypothetical protein
VGFAHWRRWMGPYCHARAAIPRYLLAQQRFVEVGDIGDLERQSESLVSGPMIPHGPECGLGRWAPGSPGGMRFLFLIFFLVCTPMSQIRG